jgi:hypothetical protein
VPKMVLLAEYLSINANVLNTFTKKAELTVEVEEKDVTNYASLGWKDVIGGLKSAEVRADQGAASTSNPKYTGSILINGWNPITGSVGDEATVSMGFPTSGAVARAVS